MNSLRPVGRMILKSLRPWPLKLGLVGSTLKTQEWSVRSVEGFNVISKSCEGWFLQTHVTVGDTTATFLPCVPGRNLKSISPHMWGLLSTPLVLGKLVTQTDHLSVIYATSLHWFVNINEYLLIPQTSSFYSSKVIIITNNNNYHTRILRIPERI